MASAAVCCRGSLTFRSALNTKDPDESWPRCRVTRRVSELSKFQLLNFFSFYRKFALKSMKISPSVSTAASEYFSHFTVTAREISFSEKFPSKLREAVKIPITIKAKTRNCNHNLRALEALSSASDDARSRAKEEEEASAFLSRAQSYAPRVEVEVWRKRQFRVI
jgi:hypothetical protein